MRVVAVFLDHKADLKAEFLKCVKLFSSYVEIMSRKQQSVSLEMKQKILNEISDGVLKKTEIAAKYGVANSTICTILKHH